MPSTYLQQKIGFVKFTISFSIFVMKMVLLKKLLFIVNVTSVDNFNNKGLKISLEQIGFNFLFDCISDPKYNQLPHLLKY